MAFRSPPLLFSGSIPMYSLAALFSGSSEALHYWGMVACHLLLSLSSLASITKTILAVQPSEEKLCKCARIIDFE